MFADHVRELVAPPMAPADPPHAHSGFFSQFFEAFDPTRVGNAEAFDQQSFDLADELVLIHVGNDANPAGRPGWKFGHRRGWHPGWLRPASSAGDAQPTGLSVESGARDEEISNIRRRKPARGR